ncbi:hypothetical protein ACOSQ4_008626 [Xanthoceras sorbifolium]
MVSNTCYSPRSPIINASLLFRLPSLVKSFACSNSISKAKAPTKRLSSSGIAVSSSDILRILHFQSFHSRETS